MNQINIIYSNATIINIENVDTDQIIPSRFLKLTNRNNLGKYLFADWRYNKNGTLKKKFILNHANPKTKILITGKNFGCGSSREHAIWAILDYGFKVIISSFFADIFKNNALNNGLLPVEVNDNFLIKITNMIHKQPDLKIKIILKKQKIYVKNYTESFYINNYKKHCLLNGYDDLEYLTNLKQQIKEFERNRKYFF